jgi:glutamyl-tRNA synthetase
MITKFEGIEDFSAENVELAFKEYLSDNEIGMGAVLPNFRVLVTGKGMGPSMFQISAILGKEETLSRLKSGLQRFK